MGCRACDRRVCENPDCERVFDPTMRRQRYCGDCVAGALALIEALKALVR